MYFIQKITLFKVLMGISVHPITPNSHNMFERRWLMSPQENVLTKHQWRLTKTPPSADHTSQSYLENEVKPECASLLHPKALSIRRRCFWIGGGENSRDAASACSGMSLSRLIPKRGVPFRSELQPLQGLFHLPFVQELLKTTLHLYMSFIRDIEIKK